MTVSLRLLKLARLVLDRGQPSLFKRLSLLSSRVARSDRTNTDLLLHEGLQEEDSSDIEEDDTVEDFENLEESDDEESDDDEDVEAFSPFPSALPQKERRQGPHPKDVSVAKPDWWNPR